MKALAEYSLLVKVQTRARFNLSGLKNNTKTSKGKAKVFGFAALMIYAIGVMLLMYLLILSSLFNSARALDEALISIGAAVFMRDTLLGMIMLLAMALSLVLGIVAIIGVVFMAKDTEIYASMPLRQSTVYASKLTSVYLTELLTSLLLLLPAGIMYSIYSGFTVGKIVIFWCRYIPVCLLLPLVPLTLAGLIAMPLVSLVAGFRYRSQAGVAIGVIALAGYVFLQMQLSQYMSGLFEGEAFVDFLSGNQALFKTILTAVPPALWAADAVMSTGWAAILGALLLTVFSGLCLWFTFLLSEKMYYRGALAQAEVKKKKIVKQGHYESSGILKTAFVNEWRIIFRTPVYVLNALSGAVLFPVIVIAMGISRQGHEGAYSEIINQLKEVGITTPVLALIFAAILAFAASINPAASTAFSREGKNISLLRSLPIDTEKMLKGRMLCFHMIASVSVITMSAVLVFVGVPVDALIYAALMALSAGYLATEVSAIPDSTSPKFSWNSETEAIKQNMNSLLGMLAAFAALLPAILAGIFLNGILPLPITTALIITVNLALGLFFHKILTKNASKLYGLEE